MHQLPPTILNFATHNEDASVEMLLVDTLGAGAKKPLRVLSVAACGTHALTFCSSPDVASVDAVDVAPAQLQLGALLRAAVEALPSVEEFAVFIGNSGSAEERRDLYRSVRERTGPTVGGFWDDNLDTIEAGVIACGGVDKLAAAVRERLPTGDFTALSKDPEAVANAFKGGMSLEQMQADMVGMPAHAMESVAEHGVPVIAAQASARLVNDSGTPGFLLELFLRGAFPMDPIESRPLFLQPETYAAIRQNGCGPERLSFHPGPLQQVGQELAKSSPFDFVDMSNILDMAPPEAIPAVVAGVVEALRPGGALLCRGHKSPGSLGETFRGCGLRVDDALSDRARAAESSFWISDVCVAYR